MKSFYKILGGLFLLFTLGMQQRAHSTNSPAYEARRQAYIDTALRNPGSDAMPIQAYRGVPIDTVALRAIVANVTTGATSDFEFEQLVRILYFAPGTYDSIIVPTLRKVHYWINYNDTLDCYWSENHMAQWMSSHWLMHERYGVYADPNLRTRLIHFLDLKIQYGYYEFFSSVYNPYCLAGLLNLADFSQDTVIKNKAIAASQLLMKDFMILTNDKGVFFPTAGRNYADKYYDPYGANHNNIIWLLTGFGDMPGGASHAGGFLSTSTIPVDVVTNSWVPDLDTTYYRGHSLDQGYAINSTLDSLDRIIFQWSAGEYFPPMYAAESFSLISDSNLWHNAVFSVFEPLSVLPVSVVPSISQQLSSASYSSILCTDTIVVFKHNSITLSSVQDYWPGKWGYQQYPCVANVGTTAVYTGSGTVAYDWNNRSATNQNDDLPYVKQVKNVALLMYRPEVKSGLLGTSDSTVALHFRNGDYSEIRNDSLWLLGRVANNYVAVRRAALTIRDSTYYCDKIYPDAQSWVIIVGDSAMYGSFNGFQAVIDSSKFTEKWYFDTLTSQVVYYAKIIIDGNTIDHAWGIDSATHVGIQNIQTDDIAMTIYPNPANTHLNIALENIPAGGTIEIYDVMGALVYQSSMHDKMTAIPTEGWGQGIYAIKVSTEAGIVSKSFMVTH